MKLISIKAHGFKSFADKIEISVDDKITGIVVPNGSVNFAFLGQFAETKRDTIFTTEYSIRTAMEAVYTLLNVDRGVPEVWGSVYDIRDLLNATVKLRDGKKATDMDMNLPQRMAVKELLKKIEGTDIELILKQYNVI